MGDTTIDTQKMWGAVLVDVELAVSKANYRMWFRDTYIAKVDIDGIVYLSVPSIFVKDWLKNKFHNHMMKIMRSMADVRGIDYLVHENNAKQSDKAAHKPITINPTGELPLNDYYINKEDNLNPRYTFDSFVVGPFNELAYAASQAVIKKPGIAYNPLFIYGETGRGKTHIIQAIGNYLKATTSKKVYYITSEKFAVDYINSLTNNKANQFKEKYRKYDVVIMDDIQFLGSKEKSQEELFHLFNNLYDDNKQIVFSSDKHPNLIPDLQNRLRSRFGAGMIIDIPQPDQESRVAILRAKTKLHNFELAPEIIEYIASEIDGNIRDLEGTLNSIIIQCQVKGKELNLGEVKNLIKNSARPKKAVAVKDIIKTIADFYSIDEASIYEKTRRKEVVKPRQIIMYILREEFDVSYPSIGQKLGGRDHTTVIHSCEKIKNDLKSNPLLAEELKQIKSMFV